MHQSLSYVIGLIGPICFYLCLLVSTQPPWRSKTRPTHPNECISHTKTLPSTHPPHPARYQGHSHAPPPCSCPTPDGQPRPPPCSLYCPKLPWIPAAMGRRLMVEPHTAVHFCCFNKVLFIVVPESIIIVPESMFTVLSLLSCCTSPRLGIHMAIKQNQVRE